MKGLLTEAAVVINVDPIKEVSKLLEILPATLQQLQLNGWMTGTEMRKMKYSNVPGIENTLGSSDENSKMETMERVNENTKQK